ncbi:Mss4-like protein [Mariannaea sp. PMI_226]|nr:Mss4-like protein [Mariannaea sp. PMI_226]
MASAAFGELWKCRPPYQKPDTRSPERETFERKIEGSCHCGKVKYWLSRDIPLSSKYCHCRDCRVLHGAPFQWAAIFFKADVAFENGTEGLRFYRSTSQSLEHELPCKVSCDACGSLIMDEGRNMALIFPTLLKLDREKLAQDFEAQCHIFYQERVMDIRDGKPKWSGLDQKSELLDEDGSLKGRQSDLWCSASQMM